MPLGVLTRSCGRLYVSGYLAFVLICALCLALPVAIGATERSKVFDGAPTRWPSSTVVYELSPAHQLAMRLVREHPESLLIASQMVSFAWDPTLDTSKLVRLSCETIEARHVRGPARMVFVTFERGRPEDLWYYTGNGITGSVLRADCLDGLSDLHLVQHFPNEGLKVLEAEVAAGTSILLHH